MNNNTKAGGRLTTEFYINLNVVVGSNPSLSGTPGRSDLLVIIATKEPGLPEGYERVSTFPLQVNKRMGPLNVGTAIDALVQQGFWGDPKWAYQSGARSHGTPSDMMIAGKDEVTLQYRNAGVYGGGSQLARNIYELFSP